MTLTGLGLDPYLGFFHQSRHGHATLASDLIEEWRPLLVDSVVLGMINRGEFSVTDFRTTRQGQLQLRSEGLNRFLKAYDARVQSSVLYAPSQQQLQYLRCIEMQVRQVAQVLSNQQAAYQPYTTR